jgi:DUF1680 family protein
MSSRCWKRREWIAKTAAVVGAATVVPSEVFASPRSGSGASQVAARDLFGLKVESFPLTQVRLLDGPFKDAQELNRRYLLSLDPARLLLMFRVTAGLSSRAKPLGGWESPGGELRGHTMGHYLSACSLMFASTSDERLKKRVNDLVAELAKCQESMPAQGYHVGYLSAYPESFFDRVDALKPVWAPWYTMHKIMAGLLDAHRQAGNTQALEVLTRLAEWVKYRVDRLTPDQMQASLKTEFGGMNEVLANLYSLTGDPDHLRLAQAFNHRSVFDPLARREDKLDDLHVNTQIPKMIGAARQYELTGDSIYRDIAEFFWQRVALHRSYALGGDSEDDEHFFPAGDVREHRTAVTAETCTAYNILKLTEHLFRWEPRASLMDFYERTLYNHILASQDPDRGMFSYYMPTKSGEFKTYSTPEDSFWCCVGTGMENHAKYGCAIYAHNADTLYLNLFIASELHWPEKGFRMRQDTRFPEETGTHLHIQTAKAEMLTIKVRRPGWIAGELKIRINGKVTTSVPDESGYVNLRRQWNAGDTVDISLPMQLRVQSFPSARALVALFYGPILLAGEMGRRRLPNGAPYAEDQEAFIYVPVPDEPVLIGDMEQILAGVQPVPDEPLTFRTNKIVRPQDLTLTPLYRLNFERYAIYWPLYSEAELSNR